MDILNLIGVVSLALLFTKYFTPIQPLKDKLVDYLVRKIVKLGIRWSPSYHLLNVVNILTCPKCLSFWSILFLTHDILLGATGGVLAMLIDNTLSKTEKEQ